MAGLEIAQPYLATNNLTGHEMVSVVAKRR